MCLWAVGRRLFWASLSRMGGMVEAEVGGCCHQIVLCRVSLRPRLVPPQLMQHVNPVSVLVRVDRDRGLDLSFIDSYDLKVRETLMSERVPHPLHLLRLLLLMVCYRLLPDP